MKNRRILLGILILAFALTVSSCSLVDDAFTVPTWARGTWYLTPKSELVNIRIDKALEIDAKTLTPLGIMDAIPLLDKTDVTIVNNKTNTVQFGLIQVKKGDKTGEIEVGLSPTPIWTTVYK